MRVQAVSRILGRLLRLLLTAFGAVASEPPTGPPTRPAAMRTREEGHSATGLHHVGWPEPPHDAPEAPERVSGVW